MPPTLNAGMLALMKRLASLLAVPFCLAATSTPDTANGGERGLWVGTIHLCRDTVESAEAGPDPYSGTPVLTIRLKPELRDQLRRETEHMVLRTLSVRIDGVTVMEPTVNEPLTVGALSLHGPDARKLGRIAHIALLAC